MVTPVSLVVEAEDVGGTIETTFVLNGLPILTTRPGTRDEQYAIALVIRQLGRALAKLIETEEP